MWRIGIALPVAIILGALAIACGGGGGSTGTTATPTGFVNSVLSDPATCQAPNGPYSHVYVTVTDVLASQSSTAAATDSASWADLTPKMTPVQIDLLAAPNNNCFLAMLGSQTQIPAGSYQQIRIILMANGQGNTITGNKCAGNDANCIVLAADNSVHTLLLSSEAQTGIKIPSGQIAGGQFTVPANQTIDIDLDFNCCASIVITGSGQYRLKPVLHAGQVSIQTNAASAITGKVVDSVTNQPIAGAKIVVALEQKDQATGFDRVIMETVADAQGNFIFCPVPTGTYDVVVDAVNGGVGYAATVTTGVAQGTAMGNVPIVATPGGLGFATIMGRVTTSTGTAATAADIQLSALQSIGGGVSATIPLAVQSSATASLTTGTGACPANTDCVSYTIQVPGVNPNIGAWAGATTTWKQDTVTPVTYTLDALAFVTMSGGTADCSPSEQKDTAVGPVSPGVTLAPNPPDLVFTGCQ